MKNFTATAACSTFFCLWLIHFGIARPAYSASASERGQRSGVLDRIVPPALPERQHHGPSVHTPFDDATAMRGRVANNNPSYTRAIGRIQTTVIDNLPGGSVRTTIAGGCTATLASPPESDVSVVVLAAHCIVGRGETTFTINGETISGLQCFASRDYSTGRPDPTHDMGVCFSSQQTRTGLYGCITPTSRRQIRPNDTLRMFGYGNPSQGQQRTTNLQSGLTRATQVAPEGTISAQGESALIQGDSGGPMLLESDLQEQVAAGTGRFNIHGINSMVSNPGLINRLVNGILRGEEPPASRFTSFFTPFSAANTDFFNRAIARYQGSNPGTNPQLCGLNFNPDGPATPPQAQSPMSRLDTPSQQPPMAPPQPLTPPPAQQSPMVPPPGQQAPLPPPMVLPPAQQSPMAPPQPLAPPPGQQTPVIPPMAPPQSQTPPAANTNGSTAINGFSHIRSGQIAGRPNRSMFGRDDQGNFVPIAINRNTGAPRAQNGRALSTDTLNDVRRYYSQNESRMTGEARAIAQKVKQHFAGGNAPPVQQPQLPPPGVNTPVPPVSPVRPPAGNNPVTPPPANPARPPVGNNPVVPPAVNPGPQHAGNNPAVPPAQSNQNTANQFSCEQVSGGYQPRRIGDGVRSFLGRLLGNGPIANQADCQRAIAGARNGIVCASTGAGWKPTHFSGSTVVRGDFGFWGSSIDARVARIEGASNALDVCIRATLNSTSNGICYWGGHSDLSGDDSWHSGDLQGTNTRNRGPFRRLEDCNRQLREGLPPPTIPAPPPVNQPRPATPPVNNPVTPPPENTNPSPQVNNPHASIAGRSCNSCHSTHSSRPPLIPEWALNQSELQNRLSSQDPTIRNEANRWANSLHSALVEGGGNMPPRSSPNRDSVHALPEIQALQNFLRNRHSQLNSNTPRPQTTAVAPNAVQVLPPQTVARYRGMLPHVADSRIQAILQDPNTLFYDEQSIPHAYQDNTSQIFGIRGTNNSTVPANAPFRDPRTGKLMLFSHAAGTDPTSATRTFHFLSLPKDANGNLQKVRVWREAPRPPDDVMGWRWEFPVGTVSGEVIYQNDSSGRPHVLEVRTRTKDSASGPSQPDIFTPVPTKNDLMARLNELRTQQPNLATEITRVEQQLRNARITPISLNTGTYQLRALQANGATSELPPMSEELTRQILSGPFRSSRGAVWDTNGTLTANAPTTRQAFGIVPQNSVRGAFGVDRVSCNRCHEQSNIPIRDLYPPGGSMHMSQLYLDTVYQYGNTPGNNFNLRWHPFEPSRIPQFGFDPTNGTAGNNVRSTDNRSINPALNPILDVR